MRIAILLAVLWCLWSGHFDAWMLSLGIISVVISVWITARISAQTFDLSVLQRTRQAQAWLRYIAWLLVEIWRANLAVIPAILNPQRIAPSMIKVPCDGLDQRGQVIYANSITLTPGTISLALEDDHILVHALLADAAADLQAGSMLKQVRHLDQQS